MNSKIACISALLLAVVLVPEAGADFLIYKLGTKGQKRQRRGVGATGAPQPNAGGMNGMGGGNSGSGREVVLYGKIKKDGGGIMYTHPDVGEPLIFQPNQVEIKHAPTMKMTFNKMLGQAGKDPEAVLHAACWALKKGLLTEFHLGIDKVLALDPQHETALRIRELKQRIATPLPEEPDPAIEKRLRSVVNQPGMHVETSNHFLLLHDTDAKAESGHHLNRAKWRLRLLEQMYERFVFLFEVQRVDLELPQERLMAVLFKNQSDFQECATRLEARLSDDAGFWSPVCNLTCFFDDSNTAESQDLQSEREKLEKTAADAKKSGKSLERQRDSETLRQIKINSVLIEIDRLNSDIASVSREATHQLAANTGLLPQRVEIPQWVLEGLAMYLESPTDEAWGGSGAVDESRIDDYRTLKDDRLRSSIDFIVEDRALGDANSRRPSPAKSAQVWALTHFLFENHAPELMAYYKMLGEMPRDVGLNPNLLDQIFSSAFGTDHESLQLEWRTYMRSLKPDVERMEESGDKAD
ncbi:MAG TPA: DUF1570 domain-containing protein [Planctomycetaceae bacterium]|jgi:hypothetical protein